MAETSSEETFKSCESSTNLNAKMPLIKSRSVAYLKNISDAVDVNGNRVIRLPDKDEFTIGRWPKADVFITKYDNMISRVHATIRYVDDTWLIVDEKSVNGIFLNRHKLSPSVEHVLNDRDEIQFGVSPGPNLSSQFIFSFRCSECDELEKEMTSNPVIKRRKSGSGECSKNSLPADGYVILADKLRAELAKKEAEAAKKARLQEKELIKLKQKLQEKEKAESSAQSELKRKEEEMQKMMLESQKQLEKEKKRIEEKVKAEMQKELKEKENALTERLQSEKEELLATKLRVEKDLQTEMEAKLEAKDNQLQEELEREKARLEKVLEKKELEQKLLESELSRTKEECQKQQTEALKEKQTTLSNFTELLETELQCAICNELFIEAMSLNCSHSFCRMCIEEWMKKKPECPICRTEVTSNSKSIVLDNYIDRMVEHLSDDLKQQRKVLIESRKLADPAPLMAPPVTVRVPESVVARQPRNRGGRSGRRRAQAAESNERNVIVTRSRARSRRRRGAGRRGNPAIMDVRIPPDNNVSASSNTRTSLLGTSSDTAIVVNSQMSLAQDASPIIIPSEQIPLIEGGEVVIDGREASTNQDPVVLSSESEAEMDNGSDDYDSDYSGDGRRRTETDEDSDEDDMDLSTDGRHGGRHSPTTDDDSDASVEGLEGSYYGGYGFCFSCGRRGHWAPGCPY